jgi:ankyrin repeat protein
METYNHKDFFDALKAYDSEKVKSLVEKFKDSIDINQVNEEGDTVLTREIGQVGIDIEDESEDESEYSLGLKLIFKNFSKVINMNQTDSEGDTLLMIACIHGCPNLVKYLIENFREAIDINIINENGDNALTLACDFKYYYGEKRNHFNVINFLIETYKGIMNINQINKDGYNALMLANKNEHKDIVKLLMKNFGNNINEKNVDDESILPCALTEHIQSKEYKIKKFESIDTIFVKIGDVIHCYTKNNTIKYSGESSSKDKKQLLLNVDTGTGRYMKTDDEGVDVYRYHNKTDTILYS